MGAPGPAALSHQAGHVGLGVEAEAALGAWGAVIAREPRAFAESLLALDFLAAGPVELAFIGPAGDRSFESLRREVGRHFLPHRIVAHHDPVAGPSAHPLLAGKGLVDGGAALYVCREFACRAPVTTPDAVAAALGRPGA